MARIVLDSSAVLAFLHEEPGAALVWEALDNSLMSAVNLAEVTSKLADHGWTDQHVAELVAELPAEIVPLDHELALEIGALRAVTRDRGLSLGDRACLALGRRLGLPVLTCDRPWASLDLGMEIRLVR